MICFAQDGIEASWNFESATSRNILCSIVRVFSAYAASVGQTSACNRRKQAQLNIEVSANRAGAERRVTLSRGTDSEAAWLPGSLPPGCGPSQPHATRGPAAGTPAGAGACRAVAVVVMSGYIDQWAALPTALLHYSVGIKKSNSQIQCLTLRPCVAVPLLPGLCHKPKPHHACHPRCPTPLPTPPATKITWPWMAFHIDL